MLGKGPKRKFAAWQNFVLKINIQIKFMVSFTLSNHYAGKLRPRSLPHPMSSGKELLPGEYQHCTTRPVLKSSQCREVASVGGKFQNTRFETPTVPGIRASASGRIIFAAYTSTEGYSDSRIISRPFPVLVKQNWLLLVVSLFLSNAVLVTGCVTIG